VKLHHNIINNRPFTPFFCNTTIPTLSCAFKPKARNPPAPYVTNSSQSLFVFNEFVSTLPENKNTNNNNSNNNYKATTATEENK
jgi:hypothetical protein